MATTTKANCFLSGRNFAPEDYQHTFCTTNVYQLDYIGGQFSACSKRKQNCIKVKSVTRVGKQDKDDSVKELIIQPTPQDTCIIKRDM